MGENNIKRDMKYLRKWNESVSSYSDIFNTIDDIFAFKKDEDGFVVYHSTMSDGAWSCVSNNYPFSVDDMKEELEHLESFLGGRVIYWGPLYEGDPSRKYFSDWRGIGGGVLELAVIYR